MKYEQTGEKWPDLTFDPYVEKECVLNKTMATDHLLYRLSLIYVVDTGFSKGYKVRISLNIWFAGSDLGTTGYKNVLIQGHILSRKSLQRR